MKCAFEAVVTGKGDPVVSMRFAYNIVCFASDPSIGLAVVDWMSELNRHIEQDRSARCSDPHHSSCYLMYTPYT